MSQLQKEFLGTFTPDADAVVRQLCRLVTDEQLSAIAAADYGNDLDQHLSELKAIKAAGRVTTIGSWHPHEVLMLIGHSRPDDPSWRPGRTGVDGWMMKAFSTAVLVTIAIKKDGNASEEVPYALGGLTNSILRLQKLGAVDCRPALTQFCAWCLAQKLDVADEPFVGLALLIGALTEEPSLGDSTVVEICEWISAAERRLAAVSHRDGKRWLISHSWSFNVEDTWSPIGAHLCEVSLAGHGEAARTWVRTLGAELSA